MNKMWGSKGQIESHSMNIQGDYTEFNRYVAVRMFYIKDRFHNSIVSFIWAVVWLVFKIFEFLAQCIIWVSL